MSPYLSLLIGFHSYLFAIALWYVVLTILYSADEPIPNYVADLFDNKVEHSYFCMGMLLLLIALGCIPEIVWLSRHGKSIFFILPLYLVMGFSFIFSWAAFVAWRLHTTRH